MSLLDQTKISARAERLKEARSRLYPSAASAARTVGLNPVTVRAHENAQNGFPVDVAKAYARAYGVTVDWLMFGGEMPDGTPNPPPPTEEAPITVEFRGDGTARLRLDMDVPAPVAIQILTLVQGGEK